MKHIILLACVLLFVTNAVAHDVITTNLTFTRDISRIFARHCLSCHAAGASIPLSTYEEARPWAVAIKEQVLGRTMPPWGAVKGFGDLAPDNGLSQEDIMIIAAWVIGGAPRGDVQLLPPMKPPATVSPARRQDGLIVQTRIELKTPVQLCGIRPLEENRIESAKLVARLPDGRIEPLVWLYRFDPKMSHDFTFRRPLQLPPGTIVESSSPVRFALQSSFKAP